MSLTQSLKEVVQSTTALTKAVRSTYAQHDAEIQKILKIAPDLQRTFYVDAVNGSDDNDGSIEAPFRRLAKAADLVPRHGRGQIYLLSDYHMREPVLARDCYLSITGNKDAYRKVTFDQYSYEYEGNEYRALHGFRWSGSSYVNLCYLNIKMPVLAPEYAGLPLSTYSTIISGSSSANVGNQGVAFRYSDIHIPTEEDGTPAGLIFGHSGPVGICFFNVTTSGASLKDHFSRNSNPASYIMNVPLDELP